MTVMNSVASLAAGHAEIAGAGFGGLAAGLSLARRGWSVIVHERGSALRSEGFSIHFTENGLRVFEALGIGPEIMAQAHPVPHRQTLDGNRMRATFNPKHRVVRLPREHIIESLGAAFQRAGGQIRFNSTAIAAHADGTLVLSSGETRTADLVVGCDGVNSSIRESLDLLRYRKRFNEGGTRIIIPRELGLTIAPEDTGIESWVGRRRLIIRPSSSTEHYVTLTCPASDLAGQEVPLNASSWAQTFPDKARFMHELARYTTGPGVRWARFELVLLKRWTVGRVAMLGDAAHAMPPNLGQGGGCAVVNGFVLGETVRSAATIEDDLRRWENKVKPLTLHTQFWSWAFGVPLSLPNPIRGLLLTWAGQSQWVTRQLQRCALNEPQTLIAS